MIDAAKILSALDDSADHIGELERGQSGVDHARKTLDGAAGLGEKPLHQTVRRQLQLAADERGPQGHRRGLALAGLSQGLAAAVEIGRVGIDPELLEILVLVVTGKPARAAHQGSFELEVGQQRVDRHGKRGIVRRLQLLDQTHAVDDEAGSLAAQDALERSGLEDVDVSDQAGGGKDLGIVTQLGGRLANGRVSKIRSASSASPESNA